MKKNVWFLGLLVCLLVWGTLIVSCDTGAEADIWSDLTSIDQLNGTWKGSYSLKSMKVKEVYELAGMEWDTGTALLLGDDMKVNVSGKGTITIDATAKTRSTDMEITMAFSGGNTNRAWPLMKPMLAGFLPGADFNDSKHSMTMTRSEPESALTDEEIEELLSSGLQINQNGTKIKMQMPADLLEGESFSELIPEEVILNKQ